MNLIAAVDRNWAIGKAGRELVNIPEDKKFFREETTGKVIVMGRKTFESLPGAMALAGRTNTILVLPASAIAGGNGTGGQNQYCIV